uniref:MetQ/NlpA family ABC transporter substrate-binding protein n=1 Tax=Coprococcus catus TaxID=116085 RepID=UPI0022E4A5E6|nr:MetQ/NlpA family ABC transporter substrate-binding protein [Coprococcus catus]
MIRFEHVSRVFHNDGREFAAVNDVSLEIEKGEIFGIIGFSGAGKSTLVRCINLLERPTSGKVFIGDEELTAMSPAELRQHRKKIGMIFQQFNLFASRTVYDNVAFPLKGSNLTKEQNVQIEIKEMGAADIPSVLPDVTAAVVNGNYALDYGIDPSTAIFEEKDYDDDSYFCLMAVRSSDADDAVYKRIVELFQSETTKQIFQDEFNGYFVPAWEVQK